MRKINIIIMIISVFNTYTAYTQPVTTCIDSGGGNYNFKNNDSRFTTEMRAKIRARLNQNIEKLKVEGLLNDVMPKIDQSIVLFWPLASTLSDYGYHRMGHFPDHNSRTNRLLDYMGGDRTYDRASDGYDHCGTDFFGWPFNWHKMDNNEIQVVAAAAGTIIDKEDGHYDRECATLVDGNFHFNSIYIRHSDGSIAWYVHFKKGSLTSKNIGSSVQVGEYLGIIGSSGWSWEPHLHFELEDNNGRMVDPNVGPENPNPSIRWAEGVQRPYYDSAINKVMTHSAPPIFEVPCPNPAIINAADYFHPGDHLYVAAYYRDQLSTQTSYYTIYKPNNTVFQSWTHSSGGDPPHPSTLGFEWSIASFWYWGWSLPLNTPSGIWKVKVIYEGDTYEHEFTVLKDESLPVFLSSFELEQQNDTVLLKWITESEIENQGFIINRKTSKDSTFRQIACYLQDPNLKGKGTYPSNSQYVYKDHEIVPGLKYHYQLLSVSYSGQEEIIASKEILINNDSRSSDLAKLQLFQNFPNPFNHSTIIRFQVEKNCDIELSIYNLRGQKVATLVNEKKSVGLNAIMWDATEFSTGVYYCKIKTGLFMQTRKMLLIK
jgi:hypothetical protein